jgi:hypothetical protein
MYIKRKTMNKYLKLSVIAIGFFIISCSSMLPMSSKKPTPFEGTWTNGDLITWTFKGNNFKIVDYENGIAVDGKIRYDDERITYYNKWLYLKFSNTTSNITNEKFFREALSEYDKKHRKLLSRDDLDLEKYRYWDFESHNEGLDSFTEHFENDRNMYNVGAPGSIYLSYSIYENSLTIKKIPPYEGYRS